MKLEIESVLWAPRRQGKAKYATARRRHQSDWKAVELVNGQALKKITNVIECRMGFHGLNGLDFCMKLGHSVVGQSDVRAGHIFVERRLAVPE